MASLFAFGIAVAACGGHIAITDDGGTGDSGPQPGLDGGPTPFDGGPIPFDASPFPDASPPPPSEYGYVLIEQIQPNMAFLTADFSPQISETCALAQPTGSCVVATCNSNGAPGASAGTISVAGGTEMATLVPMGTGMSTQYPVWQRNNAVWPIGAPLQVSATGGDVPPFKTVIDVPNAVSLVAPQANGNIDSMTDLFVAWSTSSAREVFFYMIDNSQNATTFLACFFPMQPAKGVVPSSLLRQIRATSSSGNVTLALVPTERVHLDRPPAAVEIVSFGVGSFGQSQLR